MIFYVHFSFILKISCLWCVPVSSLPILSSCQASFLLTAFMFHIDECSWSCSQKLQNRCVLFCISQVLKLKSTMARFPSFTFYYRKRTLFSWRAWNYDYKDALTWRIQAFSGPRMFWFVQNSCSPVLQSFFTSTCYGSCSSIFSGERKGRLSSFYWEGLSNRDYNPFDWNYQ